MDPQEYEGILNVVSQLHPAAQIAAVLGIAACICMFIWGVVKIWNGND